MNTTANKITIFRIILIPVFMVLAYQNLFGWALAVYIIACLSDVADGYIARHYNQVSNFGKDPMDALVQFGEQHSDIFTIK